MAAVSELIPTNQQLKLSALRQFLSFSTFQSLSQQTNS
ncbi:hypothetical protein GP5015_187 [gamma proteobacterium HTCC5015]|nr:hypothetical protein GP5015_187 [gamma proteobacterium HTCC5015]